MTPDQQSKPYDDSVRRRVFIRERCEAIFAKIQAGGNDAVTAADYRGLATDAVWLLDRLDALEKAKVSLVTDNERKHGFWE